jgi:hypothetical protein
LAHVLHYVKNAFTSRVLLNLQESLCPNREALAMLRVDKDTFVKMAKQCAVISSEDQVLFDPNLRTEIRFSPLSEDRFASLHAKIMSGQVRLLCCAY